MWLLASYLLWCDFFLKKICASRICSLGDINLKGEIINWFFSDLHRRLISSDQTKSIFLVNLIVKIANLESVGSKQLPCKILSLFPFVSLSFTFGKDTEKSLQHNELPFWEISSLPAQESRHCTTTILCPLSSWTAFRNCPGSQLALKTSRSCMWRPWMLTYNITPAYLVAPPIAFQVTSCCLRISCLNLISFVKLLWTRVKASLERRWGHQRLKCHISEHEAQYFRGFTDRKKTPSSEICIEHNVLFPPVPTSMIL